MQQAVLAGSLSKWKPFPSILTDRALVFKTDYINREAEMVPYTNARAMSAGWQWTIPTYDFISRGYVYSSQFQTDDSAWEEFGWDDARLVKFENGRYERAWTGNCVSIGLSFGFIEFARIYKSFQHTPWYPCSHGRASGSTLAWTVSTRPFQLQSC